MDVREHLEALQDTIRQRDAKHVEEAGYRRSACSVRRSAYAGGRQWEFGGPEVLVSRSDGRHPPCLSGRQTRASLE